MSIGVLKETFHEENRDKKSPAAVPLTWSEIQQLFRGHLNCLALVASRTRNFCTNIPAIIYPISALANF
jgi:hypothetical protein